MSSAAGSKAWSLSINRFASRIQQLWQKPSKIPQAVRVSVGYRLASLTKWLVINLGTRLPSPICELLHHRYKGNRKYLEEQSTVAFATTKFNRLTFPGKYKGGRSEKALVFLMRGEVFYAHNLHNYLLGCALRELGYSVSFVACTGDVECCGINQHGQDDTAGPPIACSPCRRILRNISSDGFEVINLNNYRPSNEEEQVVNAAKELDASLFNYELNGIPLLKTIEPFLMRFYQGDYRMIRSGAPEVLRHARSAIRYWLRYANLLDNTNPSCLCFFNGLFFPESIFAAEAQKRGIPSLFVERGMRRDSIFISLDEPACHYRSDQLWEKVKETITDEQLRKAESYLAERLKGPEDPTGTKRSIEDHNSVKYTQLAEKPYVVFFAPVAHDTASMEKGGPTGNIFETLTRLSATALRLRKRLVVRSHPDELGVRNPSHYTVLQFMTDQGLLHEDYVTVLDSKERWNPYRLAELSDAVMIFNGTLGMELPALGCPVFNIGSSNYTGKGFTTQITNEEELSLPFQIKKGALSGDEQKQALRYLYYYVFLANIDVSDLLTEIRPSEVMLASGSKNGSVMQLELVRKRIDLLLASRGL